MRRSRFNEEQVSSACHEGVDLNQRRGRPAQDEFKLLCSRAEITCNSSVEDDHGWDFIVEIPSPSDPGLPADKVGAPKQVLVQVKWTGGKSAKTAIKVSNALVFAKSTLPCFVVLFHKHDGGQRIYVRHFWKDLIERALRRGRECSASNRPPHKSKTEINFRHSDEHSDDLLDWLTTTVNGLPKEYGAEKGSLCASLGYEGRRYRAAVTFGPSIRIEEFVDHQLGLTDYLPVSRIKVTDSRFGIDMPVPNLTGENARMKLTSNSVQACGLVLQGVNGDVISVAGTMKSPVVPGLSTDKFKVRVETWLFDWTILGSGKMKLETHEIWQKRLPIERIVDLARFVSWSGDRVSVKLVGDGMPTLSCTGILESGGDKETAIKVLGISQTLREIQLRSGLSQVDLALCDIARSLEELFLLHEFLTAKDVSLGRVEDEEMKCDTVFSRVLGYFEVEVGGITFFPIFDAPVTEQTARAGRVNLKLGERLVRDCFVGRDRDDVRSAGRRCYETHESRQPDDWLSLQDVGAKLWGRSDEGVN